MEANIQEERLGNRRSVWEIGGASGKQEEHLGNRRSVWEFGVLESNRRPVPHTFSRK